MRDRYHIGMRSPLRLALLAVCFASAALIHADGIAPGSKAPALDVKTWYKGTPVKGFEPKKLYVVEFWATWCGPCKESIPHLTELAKKDKDVTFIGVSIWEDDVDGNIKKFVSDMGEKMDYNVGYSGNKTGMAVSWMKAAEQNGIPAAFVVKDGEIQWIGHPMEMEKPLDEIRAGKYDLAAFKKEFSKQIAASKAESANRKEVFDISNLIKAGKLADAEKRLNALEKKSAELKMPVDTLRFGLLAKQDPAKWEAKAKELGASSKAEDKDMLCMFAMEEVQNKGDLKKAQQAIDLALAGAKDSDMMLYYNGAEFYSMTNSPKKALEFMDKALEALPKSNFKDNKSAKEALTKMRAEFAAKVKP